MRTRIGLVPLQTFFDILIMVVAREHVRFTPVRTSNHLATFAKLKSTITIMPKVTVSTKAATTTDAKEVVAIAIPAPVQAALGLYSTALDAEQSVIKTLDSSILKLAMTMRASYLDRAQADLSMRPSIVAIYEKLGKDKLAAGQQFSRLLNLAWPLSSKSSQATPAQRKSAQKNLDLAIANKVGILKLNDIAAGGAIFDLKDKKVLKVEKSGAGGGSGGSNRKTPLDAYTTSIESAVTAASQAQLEPSQIIVAFVAAILACEIPDLTTAEEIRNLIED